MFHQAGDKYARAVIDTSGCIPLLIPAMPDVNPNDFLDPLDGVLLTGGYSNVDRERYGLPTAPPGEKEDKIRDANDFGLIPAILKRGMPLFAICRGLQELNIALGGTLHPRLQEVDGRFDHRENPNDTVDVQYGPAHSVTVAEGGLLHDITNEREFMVNTVHGQGIDRLADPLVIEAEADDGTIEAVSMKAANGFVLAVQWHPEWRAKDNVQSTKLFQAFGRAAAQYKSNNLRKL